MNQFYKLYTWARQFYVLIFAFILLCFVFSTQIIKAQAANWLDTAGGIIQQYPLQYLYVTDEHLISNPWNGHFNAANGTLYDVSQFYENKRLELNLRTGLNIYDSQYVAIDLPIHYDNGYKADLYNTSRYIGLGLSMRFTDGKKWAGVLHMLNLIQAGGKVDERPCYDSFRRQFHCGTGHAWQDVKNNVNGRQIDPSFSLTLIRRFAPF